MESLTVADCMSHNFVTLHPDLPVFEAAGELMKNDVLGGPVVESGKLVGWISEQDCLKVVLQVVYFDNRVATVRDIMRRDVLTTRPEESALDLCDKMLRQMPKNYPVITSDGKLTGVVSRRMILRALCQGRKG